MEAEGRVTLLLLLYVSVAFDNIKRSLLLDSLVGMAAYIDGVI